MNTKTNAEGVPHNHS